MATGNDPLATRCSRPASGASPTSIGGGETVMTAPSDALEQQLIRGYQEQLGYYDRAVNILDHQGKRANVLADNDWVQDLNAALRNVTTLDAAMTDEKVAWRRSEHRPGPELTALLERLSERIGTLAAGVD